MSLLLPRNFSASRRFPHLSWAWPNERREQLLIAAAHVDDTRAAEAFRDWLSATDLDAADFADQRLLVTAANRFPAGRLEVPNGARLNGLIRMLWTKSRLAQGSASPILGMLRSGRVDLLVLKGMVLAALDIQKLKGRIAHDIDIVIRAEDLPVAFSILDTAGWRAGRGESVHLLKQRGARFRSLNFLKPPFGDIDLHTRAYLTTSRFNEAEAGLWSRGNRTELLGTDVLVPSPTDRLVTAIAHGSLDAQRYSDWLVDCAQVIREGKVDWPLVAGLSEALGLSAQVALALFYRHEVLAVSVPQELLSDLWQQSHTRPLDYYQALLLGYPREKHSLVSSLGRRIYNYKMHLGAKVRAADKVGASPLATPDVRMRRIDPAQDMPDTQPALRHRLVVGSGARHCSMAIAVEPIDLPRRYAFEINTSSQHVARLRFNDRVGRGPARPSSKHSVTPGRRE